MDSDKDIWGKAFKIRKEIISREIAGETILVPIKGKLANMQRIFAVDNVAEYIWQQLDGHRKMADIRDGVIDLYDVGKEQARKDVLDFIEALKGADLISEVT
jgi:hypothetical protein